MVRSDVKNFVKIAIVGHGFVGKATEKGFSKNTEIFLVDPLLNSNISDLVDFNPDFIFICVPTPMKEDGSQNFQIVLEVFQEIVDLEINACVILKSTVTVDNLKKAENLLPNFVYNPEFLREKHANMDFINSDMIIFGGDRNNISINTSRRFVPSGTFDGVELPKRTKNYEYQSDVNQELRRLSEQIRKLRPSQLKFISSSFKTSVETEIQSIKIEELKKGIQDKVKEMDDIVEEEIEEIDDNSITLSMDTSALKYYSSSSSDGDVPLYQSQIIKNPQGVQYQVTQAQPQSQPQSQLYQVIEQGSADRPLYEVQKSKGKGPARPAVALYEVKMYKTPVYKVKSEVSSDEAGPAPPKASADWSVNRPVSLVAF